MRWNLLVDELAEDLRNGSRQSLGFRAHGYRRADAGARHRREHGPVLDLQQPDACVRCRCAIAGSWCCSTTARGLARSGTRVAHAMTESRSMARFAWSDRRFDLSARRSDGTGRWRVRQRTALAVLGVNPVQGPDARCLHDDTGAARGRPGRGHQPSSLACIVSAVPTTSSDTAQLRAIARSRSWA